MTEETYVPERHVMTADVAKTFNTSERAVYRWINDGTLKPAGRIGKLYYFEIEEIQRACRDNKLR